MTRRPGAPVAQLLVVDAQNDFCDLPLAWHPTDPASGTRIAPSLPVAGAHADLRRLAGLIDAVGDALSHVTVTLDSHHRLDIAHPVFWQAGDGGDVTPFTAITSAQVRDGAYRPRRADALPRVLDYLDALEARGRYTLMVWPIHCQIGTWGHNLHADVRAACDRWEERRLGALTAVFKGANPWTEHYSALQAEVPDADDPATALNHPLLGALDRADVLLVAGQASSHCVRATVEDLVDHLPGGRPDRLVLLTDCMSPVAGFEPQAAAFVEAMRSRGVRTATAAEAIARLRA